MPAMSYRRLPLPLAALAGAFAAAAVAQAQTGYFWQGEATPEGGEAIVAGCVQCDDVPLALGCGRGDQEITVTTQMGLETAEEGQLVEVAFAIDRDLYRREGHLSYNELTGVYSPSMRLGWGDPLLVALATGKEMEIALGPERLQIPLEGSAQALATMRAACASPQPADGAAPAESPPPVQR
ncbi:MAG TPA: hypothetical protein VHG92_13175 [Afifellaceae bacterium]|nr:hypothetical protein [Afifellaceae bacterium]